MLHLSALVWGAFALDGAAWRARHASCHQGRISVPTVCEMSEMFEMDLSVDELLASLDGDEEGSLEALAALGIDIADIQESVATPVALASSEWREPYVPLPTTPPADVAAAVCGEGVARVASVLSPECAGALRAFVLEELQRVIARPSALQATDEPEAVNSGHSFSSVLAPCATAPDGEVLPSQTRWDLRLPVAPPVRAAICELLQRQVGGEGEGVGIASPLAVALEALAGGADAQLWECAAVISAPGAACGATARPDAGRPPSV